ncbi:hypothetical protein KP509_09G008900 [Ceratopteris richardii]|uniref:Major facilitator superfamily (MFS) profile domain-containing protein n=1 Tax=Ceratopteris richardii TaxID=49495 RepID=A0A8T2U052_CERRI|nr:hypothetical protein KP509_09G008900 [Ceratopteris richardii]
MPPIGKEPSLTSFRNLNLLGCCRWRYPTSLPISSLFPFIYFMVRDFGIAKSETSIGSYAGYIGSALMFGRFLTSTLWGIFADKYGRKVVMMIGTGTIVVFNTIFGFSSNFWLALTSRFLLGLFNGMLGSVRAYASEICRPEHQALGLSMVGTMWGVGLIIGPAIGGYFAQPSEKYPSLFPSGSIFDRFPYALPCLCISAVSFLGLLLSMWLPESIHSSKCISNRTRKIDINGNNISEDKTSRALSESEQNRRPIWKNWGMIAAVSVYCIWGLHDMGYSEIFSLWAVSPNNLGGLGFTTSDVGNVLAVSGAALLVFQLFAFAPLANRFGAINIIRVGTVLTVPLFAVYPVMARLHGVSLWATLISAAVIKNLLSICIVTGSFILINNSVPIYQRGLANGISMSSMSLFKAIAPATAGILFSWSQERITASFLPGMWMVVFILDIFVVITLILTFEPILPKSLLKPFREAIDDPPKQTEKLERSSSFTFN